MLVVNGEGVDVADYPFYGSLRVPKSEEAIIGDAISKAMLGNLSPPTTNTVHTCGVSLVHPNIAVTAAHCVYDPALGAPMPHFMLTVAFNSNSYFSKDQAAETIEVAAVEIHPEYQPIIDPDMSVYSAHDNDIAILVLERASTTASVIPFATAETDAAPGDHAEVVGWGNTVQAPVDIRRAHLAPKKLQHAKFQVISNKKCEAFMRFVDMRMTSTAEEAVRGFKQEMVESLAGTPDLQTLVDKKLSSGVARTEKALDDAMYLSNIKTQVGASKICVSDPSPEDFSGVCAGDSGGPLFVERNGQPLLVGAASYVVGCGAGVPDTFARVSSWAEHITEIIQLFGVMTGSTPTPVPTA